MHNLTLKILVSLMGAESAVGQPMDIKEFVRKVYIHGVPYEKASKYDASMAPTLLKMLKDPREQDHWSNIVITLGMIGDESAVEPMIQFIEKRKVQRSGMMGLGYLVNKSGNQRALEYLIASLTTSARIEGFFEAIKNMFTPATAERKLNKYAAIALSFRQGLPEARA